MRDPTTLMIACFGRKGSPPYILEFATYVARLEFHDKPNYELCREMFKQVSDPWFTSEPFFFLGK